MKTKNSWIHMCDEKDEEIIAGIQPLNNIRDQIDSDNSRSKLLSIDKVEVDWSGVDVKIRDACNVIGGRHEVYKTLQNMQRERPLCQSMRKISCPGTRMET
ncbi:hypothetical protein CHS0354_030762 [Potamilus streckersoni]|uniref:Uncharacterized protein n=1 Tax=Potamilus streckersoni TaxID=2493646 RepID=A0AAE0WCB3_9BIVA|nr:hypothetical protein CHS0354_030762 [Potamilus streckersoni]